MSEKDHKLSLKIGSLFEANATGRWAVISIVIVVLIFVVSGVVF